LKGFKGWYGANNNEFSVASMYNKLCNFDEAVMGQNLEAKRD